MQIMSLERVLNALPASDGGGVKLYRVVGPDGMRGLDPFLMLDEFGSESADDYIAGFPPHPHRGFETVTYMLEGRMLHEDHLGHRGLLSAGGVQWMTAGRGVIHSEMPQQDSGRMHGFQLWVNLPAAEKMRDPAYRHVPAEAIPVATLATGARVKVIAGVFADGCDSVIGAVQGLATAPLFLDARVPPEGELEIAVPAGHRALVYPIAGRLDVAGQCIGPRQMAVMGRGERLALRAGDEGAQALILAGRPLGEPIVHHGPFVMNTRAEIAQAIRDYESGRLVA